MEAKPFSFNGLKMGGHFKSIPSGAIYERTGSDSYLCIDGGWDPKRKGNSFNAAEIVAYHGWFDWIEKFERTCKIVSQEEVPC